MQDHVRQLPIPGEAASDPNAIELLRVWAAKGKQQVALATGLWDDPANWGIMLVDLVKHIANAYEQTEGLNRSETVDRIRAGLEAEWSSATDDPTGQVMK
jgi:hypothetical protein